MSGVLQQSLYVQDSVGFKCVPFRKAGADIAVPPCAVEKDIKPLEPV